MTLQTQVNIYFLSGKEIFQHSGLKSITKSTQCLWEQTAELNALLLLM